MGSGWKWKGRHRALRAIVMAQNTNTTREGLFWTDRGWRVFLGRMPTFCSHTMHGSVVPTRSGPAP